MDIEITYEDGRKVTSNHSLIKLIIDNRDDEWNYIAIIIPKDSIIPFVHYNTNIYQYIEYGNRINCISKEEYERILKIINELDNGENK
jgi:hypothetical protein